MQMTAAVAAFWDDFCRRCAGAPRQAGDPNPGAFYEAFHFGDTEALAQELAALVLAGTKRATASAWWSYEAGGRRAPQAGDLSVVTDWHGQPLCVIRSTRVDRIPFDAVPAEFAAAEGEGDGSLAWWRQAHTLYFTRECARLGRAFAPDMPVCCERFEVVHRR